MRPSKSLTTLSLLLAVAVVCSCANMGSIPEAKVYNEPYCAIAGKFGARCFETLTDRRKNYTKAEWDEVSIGWIAVPSQSFHRNTTTLEQFCAYTKRCTYEEVQEFKRQILPKINSVRAEVKKLTGK